MTTRPARIIIVDDHPVVRSGLAEALARGPHVQLAGEAGSGAEAMTLAGRERPDIALVDLRLPDMHGTVLIRWLHDHLPACRAIAISSFARAETVRAAVEAGARGYLIKETPLAEIRSGLDAVLAGRRCFGREAMQALAEAGPAPRLTERERAVLALMAAGLSTAELADRLGVTEGTAGVHVRNVLGKLGVPSRGKAVALAFAQGLIDVDGLPEIV